MPNERTTERTKEIKRGRKTYIMNKERHTSRTHDRNKERN